MQVSGLLQPGQIGWSSSPQQQELIHVPRQPLLTPATVPGAVRWKGVGWDRKFGCWRVRIFFNGKQRHVGRFRDAVTAARAYNKVVVFLYGERAITNLLQDSGDDGSTDTFDIPFAIRQAKLEAQQQPTSTQPSIHPSTSFSTSSAASSTGSGDSLTTHGGGNSSSSASMQQLASAAGGPAMLQLHDPLLLLPPYGGLSSLLPLSCGPGGLADSTLDSSFLQGHTFTSADLASTTVDVLHPSMGFLDITGASTACMQMQVPIPAGSAAFSVLQEPSSSMASTQGLLADTTQQLQLMNLSSSSLLHGPSPVSYSAPDALLGAGFLQASTGPHMVQELHLTGMQHVATTLDTVLATELPTLLPAASSAVYAGLLLGAAAAQHAGDTPGVVMGFPVAAHSLCMPAQAQAAPQSRPLIGCVQSSPVVASNGMVVMFAPAPPA